jgi:hypothetical protein
MSAAAAGRTMTCFTDPGYEFDQEPRPKVCRRDLRVPGRLGDGPVLQAGRLRAESSRVSPRGCPRAPPAGQAALPVSTMRCQDHACSCRKYSLPIALRCMANAQDNVRRNRPASAQDGSGSADDRETAARLRPHEAGRPGCRVRLRTWPDAPPPAEVAGGGVNRSYAHRNRAPWGSRGIPRVVVPVRLRMILVLRVVAPFSALGVNPTWIARLAIGRILPFPSRGPAGRSVGGEKHLFCLPPRPRRPPVAASRR